MMVDLGPANVAALRATSLSDMAKTEAKNGIRLASFDNLVRPRAKKTLERTVVVKSLRVDNEWRSELKICPSRGTVDRPVTGCERF